MTPHLGRDYSSFQGELTPADCAGIDFAYCKLTEGASYKNPDAVAQVAALHAAGVKYVGYYHFFDPGVLVNDQLDNFLQYAVSLGPSPLPLALDFETPDPLGNVHLASQVMQFAMRVEAWNDWVPNERSLLYTYPSMAAELEVFPWGRWVWLSDPDNVDPTRTRLITQGAPRPVSSTDTKVIDPDIFVGTESDWALFTRTTTPVTLPVAVTTDKEDNLQVFTLTLPVGLDANGNGYYTLPQIPDTTLIESIEWLGDSPQQHYDVVPSRWYAGRSKIGGPLDSIVVEGGQPGAQYACIITVRAA